MNIYIQVIISLLLFILLDFLWFQWSVPNLYNKQVKKIQGKKIDSSYKMIIGLIAWILLVFGIYYFVLNKSTNLTNVILNATIYGLIVYGVFNITNYVLFKKYDPKTMLIDTSWGIFICVFVSMISYFMSSS